MPDAFLDFPSTLLPIPPLLNYLLGEGWCFVLQQTLKYILGEGGVFTANSKYLLASQTNLRRVQVPPSLVNFGRIHYCMREERAFVDKR